MRHHLLLPLHLLLLLHLLQPLPIQSTIPRLPHYALWGIDEKARAATNLDSLDRALRSAGVERPLHPRSTRGSTTPTTSTTNSPRFTTHTATTTSADETTGAPGIKGGGDCLGLVRKNCAPCPPPEMNTAGAAGGCELIDAQCDNLFCDPLCLNKIIDCSIKEIKDAQFSIISKDTAIETALCSEFKAHACSDAKCCDKKDPMLQAWVEEDAYGTTFPEPLMLIEACKHNPLDPDSAKKLCGDCKKAIKGNVVVKPFEAEDVCTPMNSFYGTLADPIGEKDDGVDWTPYNTKFGFPFIGAHQMFKQRCERLVTEMEGHLAGLISAFEDKACNCLGCCDPVSECWFPIVESPEDAADGWSKD